MTLFRQFEKHWIDRAKATSLLLAHEENAEWVEDQIQLFAKELEEGLVNIFPSFDWKKRQRLIKNAISYIWNRKLAIECEGAAPGNA